MFWTLVISHKGYYTALMGFSLWTSIFNINLCLIDASVAEAWMIFIIHTNPLQNGMAPPWEAPLLNNGKEIKESLICKAKEFPCMVPPVPVSFVPLYYSGCPLEKLILLNSWYFQSMQRTRIYPWLHISLGIWKEIWSKGSLLRQFPCPWDKNRKTNKP